MNEPHMETYLGMKYVSGDIWVEIHRKHPQGLGDYTDHAGATLPQPSGKANGCVVRYVGYTEMDGL